MKPALTIAIVGHANTGKTSLLRTLLRNSQFGDVRDEAGTTRHVESAAIALDHQLQIEFRDTPGLEDSSALRAYLGEIEQQGHRSRDCLQKSIDAAGDTPDFEQEIKVIKQTLQCQILLYVIDCREPIFAKYIDEIAVLRLAAIPILPVLNFIHDQHSSLASWKQKLAELGLHALVAFDTVAFDFEAERRLYQKLQTLLEEHHSLLQRLLDKRQADWLQLQKTASLRIAHLLYDIGKLELKLTSEDSPGRGLEHIQNQVRAMEQQALTAVLHIMQFNEQDVAMSQLPVQEGNWQLDIFSAQTLKTLGLDTASAAATGAAVGVGIDLLFAGMSLGAATATGAALGTAWHTGKRFGKNILNKLSGHTCLRVDDTTLDILLLRQLWLLNTLFHRGHAANTQSRLTGKPNVTIPNDWRQNRQTIRASAAGWGMAESDVVNHIAQWISDQVRT